MVTSRKGFCVKVTAAIFRNGDNVLLMRRGADQPLAGEWEYPGGKFEDGEDGPTCLCRELAEELGIDAQIGNLITIAKHTTDSAGIKKQRRRTWKRLKRCNGNCTSPGGVCRGRNIKRAWSST